MMKGKSINQPSWADQDPDIVHGMADEGALRRHILDSNAQPRGDHTIMRSTRLPETKDE